MLCEASEAIMNVLRVRRTGATLLATGLVAVAAVACGGSSAATPATEGAPAPSAAAPAGPPGASGTIAAVNGNVVQVQNAQSGQVAVTVGDSTTITNTVAATAADLAVGDCAMVTSAGAAQTDVTAPVAATAVSISTATGQGCRFGGPMGGGGGNRTRPSGANPSPTGTNGAGNANGGGNANGAGNANGGGNGNGGGRGRGTFGAVTAVTATGFTVQPDGNGAAPVTVTTSGSTTYTKTVAANTAALVVGQCATATGTADDTGAITATAVSVRPPGANGCATGFGGRGGQGGNGQGGGQGGGQAGGGTNNG
jgi:hypothetical protein